MKYCKVCNESLINREEKLRGTCDQCENAITKIVAQKLTKGYQYYAKNKFKTRD